MPRYPSGAVLLTNTEKIPLEFLHSRYETQKKKEKIQSPRSKHYIGNGDTCQYCFKKQQIVVKNGCQEIIKVFLYCYQD